MLANVVQGITDTENLNPAYNWGKTTTRSTS